MGLTIDTLDGGPSIVFGDLPGELVSAGRSQLSAPALGLVMRDLRLVASPGVTDGLAVIDVGFRGRGLSGCVLMYWAGTKEAVQDAIDADRSQIQDSSNLVVLTIGGATADRVMQYVICKEFEQIRDAKGRLIKGPSGGGGCCRGYVKATFSQFALG